MRSREQKLQYWRGYYQQHKPRPQHDKIAQEIGEIAELDIAYMAGLVDGEGSMTIARPVHGTWAPSIDLILTHQETIEWFARLLKTSVKTRPPRDPIRHRPQYHARVNGYRAASLARRMLPYMHIKKAHAEIFQRFAETYKSQRRNDGFHEEVIHDQRQRLHLEIRQLNARLVPSNRLTARCEVGKI